MKKIPLHTIIFFYLSLVPVVLFMIAWGICIFQGDPGEIFDGMAYSFASFPATTFLAIIVVYLQISAIVNYVDAYKQVYSYSYKRYNENKIPLFTVKCFYFSIVISLIFVIVCGTLLFYGFPLAIIILLAPVVIFLQTAAIVGYSDARKQVRENKESHTDKE
ncbi:MAG: hypothetical protein NC244_01300 [Alistipes senegalensis]|nr:hypothetical protein [Alistipes senegalensis]